jgi:hypothetical protein
MLVSNVRVLYCTSFLSTVQYTVLQCSRCNAALQYPKLVHIVGTKRLEGAVGPLWRQWPFVGYRRCLLYAADRKRALVQPEPFE